MSRETFHGENATSGGVNPPWLMNGYAFGKAGLGEPFGLRWPPQQKSSSAQLSAKSFFPTDSIGPRWVSNFIWPKRRQVMPGWSRGKSTRGTNYSCRLRKRHLEGCRRRPRFRLTHPDIPFIFSICRIIHHQSRGQCINEIKMEFSFSARFIMILK